MKMKTIKNLTFEKLYYNLIFKLFKLVFIMKQIQFMCNNRDMYNLILEMQSIMYDIDA